MNHPLTELMRTQTALLLHRMAISAPVIGSSCGPDTGQSAKSEVMDLGRIRRALVEFRQGPQVGGGALVRAVAVLACGDSG